MRTLALLTLLLLTPLRLLAQTEVAPAEDDEIDLGVVVVEAESLPAPANEYPDEEVTPEAEPSTLAELLESSTSLTVIDGSEIASSPSIADALERVAGTDIRRSGGAGQLDTVLLRGARAQQVLVLLDGAPLMPGQVADLALLPASGIARIEVLRGPEAARFGSGALGGVLNVVTADSVDSVTQATLRAGGHDMYAVDLSGAGGEWDWHVSHMSARNEYSFERQAGAQAVRLNNDAQRQQLWLRHSGERDVRLGLSRLERGVPGSAEFPTLEARLARENLWLQVDGTDSRADFSLQHTRFHDPQPYLMQGAIDTADTRLHAELSYGVLALKPGRFGVRPRLDWISSYDYDTHMRGGIDLGWFDSVEHGRLTQHSELGTTVSSDAGADPLARYELSYELSDCASAYASAGYAVRHPDFEELYLANSGSVQGNPDLRPERVLNYEAGLRLRGARWDFSAAAFHSDYRDSIIFAPVSAYLVRAINTGAATVTGAEASFALDLSDALSWSTAATWLPVAELASGLPLPGRAEQHISSTLALRGSRWRASATADYTGTMTADMFGSLKIAPRTIVNLDAWHTLGADAELGVQLTNAFDVNTRDAWHYPLPGREVFLTWRTNL